MVTSLMSMEDEMTSTLINGQWLCLNDAHEVRNPVDGTIVGCVDRAGQAEAKQAVAAAEAAAAGWAALTGRERADFLLEAARLISEREESIAALLAKEAGKRLPEAIGEVRGSADYFRWFAEEIRRSQGVIYQHEDSTRRHLSIMKPAGVVATLTPWNFPCSIQARKLAPALAAGCTVVARVSDKAPLAVTEMFRCLTEAGIPDGVVNLVHGPAAEITEAYLSQSAVRVVSFTGSTAVGARVMELASRHIVRPLLELGGDAPFIVFDDADLDQAVENAMLAKFRNTGQSCIGANRFLIQEGVYEDFMSRFAEAISAMSVGDGVAEEVPDLGPCIDQKAIVRLSELRDEAIAGGARQVSRTVTVPEQGAFFAPTLLENIPADCRIASEEIFGPIATAWKFETEEEAIACANSTSMGLAGYVCTTNLGRAWRVMEHLNVGVVGINEPLPTVPFAPMGGVKESGLGREGASHGLEEFQEVCYASMRF